MIEYRLLVQRSHVFIRERRRETYADDSLNPEPSLGIKLDDYLQRIVKFASVEPSVILLLLVYVDRICEINPTFTISSLTVHRFIIAAVTAGSKALSDIYCTNTYYARVGGISLQELNIMEMEFCKMIGWRLSCDIVLLQQYYANLVRTSPVYVLAPPPPMPAPALESGETIPGHERAN
ncbi:hypothetical protein HDU87_002411 [Geranomyces variabilis]|uniref:Cyclin n=1 Tax=Geranomyces variabilis TaxID=109894 RepID=A0AAD5XN93_9FUNG|nr:hypothetical protein HDU87_002411 [Geranomyces variabilis]